MLNNEASLAEGQSSGCVFRDAPDSCSDEISDVDPKSIARYDLHCHLGFMENPASVAAKAQEAGVMVFNNSVTPSEWLRLKGDLDLYPNVLQGLGMHPWWVGGNDSPSVDGMLQALEQYKPKALGEIGLDFGPRHKQWCAQQQEMLEAILRWAASVGDRLLCLHAVHSAGEVFDMLEHTGALSSCTCLFHWFTGPSDLLKQAIAAGCYFSCGPRMLATAKGKEYVKAIPSKALVLETDAPPAGAEQNEPFQFYEQMALLEEAAAGVGAIKGAQALEDVAKTSLKLIGPRSPFR